MAKNPGISVDVLTASRKSKLASVISLILSLGKNIFISTIKDDANSDDIIKNLDILQRSQNIRVKPQSIDYGNRFIPMSLFIQRHNGKR